MIVSPTSCHEAGHAVISVVLGLAVDEVMISPPRCHYADHSDALGTFTAETTGKVGRPRQETFDNIKNKPATGTSRAYTVGRLKRERDDLSLWRAAALRALAGPVSEIRITGESIRACLCRNASDRATAVGLVRLGLAPVDSNAALRELLDETHALVLERWGAILAVARALAISHELLGHEVERIIRRAQAA